MKIEKIKNYNQKVLAILGTLAIVLVIVITIGIGGIAISEFTRLYNYEKVEEGILSDEKIEKLQKENKRKQVISYQSPKLIDTLNSVYIIPVSHKNLDEAEETEPLNLIKTSDNYKSSDIRYSSQLYGAYNNLIIYNQKNDTTYKLFDKRVNFNQINTEYFPDDILLLFKVAEKDTHKDGVINLLDYKSLYIYSINEKRLRKIGNEEMSLVSYQFLNDSKDLIIRFGIDKNKDGKYEEYNEPAILRKYDYQTAKLIDIIGKKTNRELQKTLESTKK